MTSISPVSSSGFSPHVSKSKRGEGPEKGLQRDLTDYLTTQGVSAADQKSILNDIKSAIDASAGTGSRPDLSKIQASVSKVLEQHGLSSTDFAKQFPPPTHHEGRSPASPSSTSSASGTNSAEQQSSLQQLLEILNKQAERTRQRTQATPATETTSDSAAIAASTTAETSVANTIKTAYASSNVEASLATLSLTV